VRRVSSCRRYSPTLPWAATIRCDCTPPSRAYPALRTIDLPRPVALTIWIAPAPGTTGHPLEATGQGWTLPPYFYPDSADRHRLRLNAEGGGGMHSFH
jgi:hypothetical protein